MFTVDPSLFVDLDVGLGFTLLADPRRARIATSEG
jgi:hypothetical protein